MDFPSIESVIEFLDMYVKELESDANPNLYDIKMLRAPAEYVWYYKDLND